MPDRTKKIKCKICGKIKTNCAKGMCDTCYKKYGAPQIICKKCNQITTHYAKGMCRNCWQKDEYYDKIKESNIRRWHNISLNRWKQITSKCFLCDFDKVIELHHIDGDKKNNSDDNLIGLCPNHHRMIHNREYKDEIALLISKKMKEMKILTKS